jgi:UDP-2,4-diacetamido-2,4,6-trideoxy-beta-L-altropyranose hydrolase
MSYLLLRADGNSQIGTGHLMRALALGKAWQSHGGRATLLTCCDTERLIDPFRTSGITVSEVDRSHPHPTDLERALCTAGQLGMVAHRQDGLVWLALDGYTFDPGYQRAIRAAGYHLLVIDDTAHLPEYHAHLLLNQNIDADQRSYHCVPDTLRLFGPDYALLRPEFLTWRDWERQIPEVAVKVLITLGGADPTNATLKVIHALRRVSTRTIEARIIIGAANPYHAELQSILQLPPHNLKAVVAATDMPRLMAWADVAISAAGSTSWELAFMGVPSLLLITADNQHGIGSGLAAAGAAISLGRCEELSIDELHEQLARLLDSRSLRERLSRRARSLVDGNGATRVVSQMKARLDEPDYADTVSRQ